MEQFNPDLLCRYPRTERRMRLLVRSGYLLLIDAK